MSTDTAALHLVFDLPPSPPAARRGKTPRRRGPAARPRAAGLLPRIRRRALAVAVPLGAGIAYFVQIGAL